MRAILLAARHLSSSSGAIYVLIAPALKLAWAIAVNRARQHFTNAAFIAIDVIVRAQFASERFLKPGYMRASGASKA